MSSCFQSPFSALGSRPIHTKMPARCLSQLSRKIPKESEHRKAGNVYEILELTGWWSLKVNPWRSLTAFWPYLLSPCVSLSASSNLGFTTWRIHCRTFQSFCQERNLTKPLLCCLSPDQMKETTTKPSPGSLGVAALVAFLTLHPQMKTRGRYQKHLSPLILRDTGNISVTLSLPSVHGIFSNPDIPDVSLQRWLYSHIWHMLRFIAFKVSIVHMCVHIFLYMYTSMYIYIYMYRKTLCT